MGELFLDVSGNVEPANGYQIEDSIAKKYFLKPGDISPFTHLRIETLSPEKARKVEEARKEAKRLEEIKQKKVVLRKEKQRLESDIAKKKEDLSAIDGNIAKYIADINIITKSISDLNGNLSTTQNDIQTKTTKAALLEEEQTPSILKANQPKITTVKEDIQKAVDMLKKLSSSVGAKNKILERLNGDKVKLDRDKVKLEGEISALNRQIEDKKKEIDAIE